MRQVFGEWGVVTETKSASYGILSAPVANNIRGYPHIVLGNVFDIHSITIGDILFNLVKRIISISKIQRRLFLMVDKAKIEQAVRLLLEGIGEDITREGLIDTPDRIARMCEEIYGGLGHEADQHLLKQFPVEK